MLFKETNLVFLCDLHYVGGLQGFDVQFARFFRMKTTYISYPPLFNGKLEIMFFPFSSTVNILKHPSTTKVL